ncbi:hypothetical protein [Wolbachia endosymbiont (group A) of Campoletis raptor]|uniref:hypothetical protein n=1 Tax=Wolbachia endosymbiont (group A) of Campoletis raptor TaxID=3066196 RepID=UPI003132A67A
MQQSPLGSRLGTKLVNTKALYNVFDGTVQKDWMPVGFVASQLKNLVATDKIHYKIAI